MRRQAVAERGTISVFVAVCASALVIVVGIVLDCGGRLQAVEQADARAEEAARVVGQQLDQSAVLQGRGYTIVQDRRLATDAADAYLSPYHLHGDVRFDDDHTVTVRIDTTYDTALLGVIAVTTLPVHGQGQATLVHGITEAENA